MRALPWIPAFAVSFAFAAAIAGGASAGDVVVEVSGLEHSSGELRVALFDSEEAFLVDEAMAAGIRVKLSLLSVPSAVVVTLHGIAPGRYAVTAHHDEDGDGKRATNLLGIPTEGYGFSNAATGLFGPPDFEAAAIEVGEQDVRVAIKVSY